MNTPKSQLTNATRSKNDSKLNLRNGGVWFKLLSVVRIRNSSARMKYILKVRSYG